MIAVDIGNEVQIPLNKIKFRDRWDWIERLHLRKNEGPKRIVFKKVTNKKIFKKSCLYHARLDDYLLEEESVSKERKRK